jgi:predicted enzyme related to lactoylglutathione lyase
MRNFNNHTGENSMNNPVAWFEIYVSDMKRAQQFYESVFNVQLSDLGDPSDSSTVMKAFPADMSRYGATGALVQMAGFAVGQNSVLVYFSCDNCALEESRVISCGGKIEKSKYSIGEYGFISVVVDCEGNMFGLHSLK